MPPEFRFEPYTTFYKPQNAYWLARASQLVYARKAADNPAPDGEFILKELQTWDKGFTEVVTFHNKSTQAFVAKHDGGGLFGSPGFVIIAFRGTDEKADWVDNLGLSAVDFPAGRDEVPYGRVHGGFYRAFLDIWEEKGDDDECTMRKLLERDDYKRKPFWLTGHSLGGALASICAFNFAYHDVPFYGVYTYGQPRSCKRDLKLRFDLEAKDRYFRFQNNNDVVSRVPQRFAGYTHLGTFIYIDINKNLTADVGKWFQFSDRIDGVKEYLSQLKGGVFRDHDISDYIDSMEKSINRLPKGIRF
ncbi:MAG: lipase family protein [Limnothrix sp.]